LKVLHFWLAHIAQLQYLDFFAFFHFCQRSSKCPLLFCWFLIFELILLQCMIIYSAFIFLSSPPSIPY
jgi:hypothetical protein